MRPSSKHPWLAATAATALISSAIIAAPATASGPPDGFLSTLAGSHFEIDTDADLVAEYTYTDLDPTPYLDWNSVNEVRGTDLPTGQLDDSYKGGVKEDTTCPGEVTGSIPNNKSDLLTFSAFTEPGVGTHPGFLNIAWSRVSDPSGTTLMDFEFNKSSSPCADGPNVERSVGDLLIEYSITQGGAQAAITFREWDGSVWGPATVIPPSLATGTINSSPIAYLNSDGILASGSMQARTFGEATIDLNAIFDPAKCESFGSAMIKSRSSDSFTSQLKDFIAPQPVDIQNCGTVRITKQTNPDEESNATLFSFDEAIDTDPAGETSTFTLTDDQTTTQFEGNVLFGTGYTVEEGTLPDGWDFTSIDCSASKGVTPSSIVGKKVTFDIDNASDVLDCTYTNSLQKGSILVEKVVAGTDPAVRLDGASFALDGDGDTETTDDQTSIGAVEGKSGLFCVDGLLFGDYFVVETVAPDGYAGETAARSVTVSEKSTCAERTGDTVDTPDVTFENTANPAISTVATLAGVLGGTISDTATLSGGYDPTGTITFTLYSDGECADQVWSDTVTVDGNGAYTSGSYTVQAAGGYYWVAAYSGDSSNNPVSGSCGDENEFTSVPANLPAIVTQASGPVTVGEGITDTATLSGGYSPTGTITFTLYSDDECLVQVWSDTVTVDGNGDYTSGSYTTTAAGTYYWIAAYDSDTTLNDDVSGLCGDANESTVVGKSSPTLNTAPVLLPNDSATLSGGYGTLGGTLTFELYDTLDCTGEALYDEVVSVDGADTYWTDNTEVTITADGTYSWYVAYSGDDNNNDGFSSCTAERQVIDFAPLAVPPAD